jgi:hypothetical protein
MKEPTFEVIAGIAAAAFGGFILYGSSRPALPRWLHAWWLREDMPSRVAIERTLAVVVGFGFVGLGVVMILAGAGALLGSSSAR